jgi:hypothetical protein
LHRLTHHPQIGEFFGCQVTPLHLEGVELLLHMQGECAEIALHRIRPGAIVGRNDVQPLDQIDVEQTAAQALVHIFQPLIGSDNCGQLGIVAVVEQLEELLLCPGRGALAAQIVQNQQTGGAHLLEGLVVLDFAVGAKGGAQVVEQIGHDDENGGLVPVQPFIGDGRGQMGLATAVAAGQDQPAFRVLGKGHSRVVGPAQSSLAGLGEPGRVRVKLGKGVAGQRGQVAHGLEFMDTPPEPLLLFAVAGNGLAKVRVAQGHVRQDKTRALTAGAGGRGRLKERPSPALGAFGQRRRRLPVQWLGRFVPALSSG